MKEQIAKFSVPVYNEIAALRSTHIKKLLLSPMHYMSAINDNEELDKSKALILGDAIHSRVLEPDEYSKNFTYIKTSSRLTKDYKTALEKLRAEGSAKQVLLENEAHEVEEISNSLLANPHMRSYLEAGYVEMSAIAHICNTWVKARADIFIPDQKAIVDIKTTAEPVANFKSVAMRYGYDLSAALYLDTFNKVKPELELDTFIFVVVEKFKPYGVKLFKASPRFIKEGRVKYMEALEVYKRAVDSDLWLGYDNSIIEEI